MTELDEAAQKLAEELLTDGDTEANRLAYAFKAGAEWAMEQNAKRIKDAIFTSDSSDYDADYHREPCGC